MEYVQQMLAVAVVLGLLGGLLWYSKRRGWVAAGSGPRAARRLQPLERLALGPHHSLHLVRVGEEALLVACSPGGCALLERVPPEAAAPRGVRP
jgi:flagellar biosynthetic protein FliO